MKKTLFLLFLYIISFNFVSAKENIRGNTDLFVNSLYEFKNSNLNEINNYIDEKGSIVTCNYIDVEIDSEYNYKTENSLIVGNKDLLCNNNIKIKDFTKKTLLSQVSLSEEIIEKYKNFQDEKFRSYNAIFNNGRVRYDFSIIGDYKQSNSTDFNIKGNFLNKMDSNIKNIYKNLNICYLSKSTKEGLIECLNSFISTVENEKSGFLDSYDIKYSDFKERNYFYKVKESIDKIDFSKYSYQNLVSVIDILNSRIELNNGNKEIYVYLRDKVQEFINNL